MEKLEQTLMSNKVKERIEKEAEAIIEKEIGLKPGRSLLTPMDYGEALRCIVAGIQAERPKAWNEAIDECIAVVDACPGSFVRYTDWHELLEQLKVLKDK